MPFCSKCGTEVPENVNFCQKCGNSLQSGQNSSQTSEVTPVANTGVENLQELSDKWVWTLACVPILGMILESIFLNVIGDSTGYAGTAIFVILNIIFITLDMKELNNKNFNPDGWLWLGVLLVPVYLFVRASKTNKKYGYAITWCVLFVLSLFFQSA